MWGSRGAHQASIVVPTFGLARIIVFVRHGELHRVGLGPGVKIIRHRFETFLVCVLYH